ncbi:MAG: hypothetical protein ABIJ74_04155 [archaeon]
MIDELSLLRLHPETASTKQKIIDLLSNEYPLTAKSIHSKLQKAYSAEISYQGAYKTLKEMEEKKVLEKNKNKYLLNLEWVQKSKKKLEEVEKNYLQNNKIVIPEDFSGSITIEFDSITDLCVSTAELLWSRQLNRAENEAGFFAVFEYGWWPFRLRFKDYELLLKMVKANPATKGLIRKKTPFGEWINKQYHRINATCLPIGTKFDINEDIFIVGNYLIEVNFDEETKKILEHYYNKWKDLTGSFKEFGLKEEPKTHSVMRITKNPEMAEYLRKQLNKVFEGAKK